jgi:hypothetical protein
MWARVACSNSTRLHITLFQHPESAMSSLWFSGRCYFREQRGTYSDLVEGSGSIIIFIIMKLLIYLIA